MKMRVLILDDDPNDDGVVGKGRRLGMFRDNFSKLQEKNGTEFEILHVVTARECIEKIVDGVDMIFLDHDLGGKTFVDSSSEDCGMRVVDFIVAAPWFCEGVLCICIHSFNTAGGKMMAAAIEGATKMEFVKGERAPTVIWHPGIFLPDHFEKVFS